MQIARMPIAAMQIEHAPHLSEGAALVKFADKIANLLAPEIKFYPHKL